MFIVISGTGLDLLSCFLLMDEIDSMAGMLTITVPDDNLKERLYTLDVMIGEYIGIPYQLKISNELKDYCIQYEKKQVLIKDGFFSKHENPLSYLNVDNIPDHIRWFGPNRICSEPIPFFFGENVFYSNDDLIVCGLDIFACTFFMLSRWEETVSDKCDQFGRFPEDEMLAVKFDIHERPVVNEYCEVLKKLIGLLSPDFRFLERTFTSLITHDIDYLFRFGSLKSLTRNIAGDLLNRKSINQAFSTLNNYHKYLRGDIKDPFNTFDELMDLSEFNSLKSSFYFIPLVKGEKGCDYSIFDSRVSKIMNNIQQRGHEIGFHPSALTFHNQTRFSLEHQRIESLGFEVSGGRQHYLLYDIKETFHYWEKAGLQYDTGLGFSSHVGFRCGTCIPFRLFSVTERRMLNLYEKPMCVMDAALIPKLLTIELMYSIISNIITQVRKHSGLFVFLLHNDGFSRYENIKYKGVFKEIMALL